MLHGQQREVAYKQLCTAQCSRVGQKQKRIDCCIESPSTLPQSTSGAQLATGHVAVSAGCFVIDKSVMWPTISCALGASRHNKMH